MAKRRAAKELRKADEWANAYFRTRTISFVCGMLVCLKLKALVDVVQRRT